MSVDRKVNPNPNSTCSGSALTHPLSLCPAHQCEPWKWLWTSPYLTSVPWKTFVKLSFDVSQRGCEKCQSESVLNIYDRNQKIIRTIVELVWDFLQPCMSLQPSLSQLFLQRTSSSRPIWLQHCVVESIVDPCCPTVPSSVFSSSSTASLQVSQTMIFMFGLDWVTFTFGRQLFCTQAASS